MAEWTSDAQEYLDGYLRQVSALARARGDEADEIAGELQAHIVQEAENAAGPLVTMEHLRKVLVAIGSPEQVAEGDPPFGVPVTPGAPASPPFDPAKAPPPPPPPPQQPQVVVTQPSAASNPGCWLAAIVAGVVAFFLFIAVGGIVAAIMLPALSRARESARRAACQGNLKQIGLTFKMFSDESRGGLYPELSPEAGRLMFANESACSDHAICTDYLTDPTPLLCPIDMDSRSAAQANGDDPCLRLLDDHSYFYLGYAVTNEAEMATFARAYSERVAAGLRFDEDLPVAPGAGTAGGDVLLRLTNSIGQTIASDGQDLAAVAVAESETPVLIERAIHHVPHGGNVLYLDGHVEFLKYPSRWPMTPETIELLAVLDDL